MPYANIEDKRKNRKKYASTPEAKELQRIRSAKYRAKPETKEKTRITGEKYRQKPEVKEHNRLANKEYNQRSEVKERAKNRRQRPETKEWMKKYRQRPEVKERNKESSRKYYKTEFGKAIKKSYRQRLEVKERAKIASRNRQLLKRTNGTGVSNEQWMEILEEYNHGCAYCGKIAKETKQGYLTQDHVLAIDNGGEHSPENIAPACVSCNSSKGNKYGWVPEIFATIFLMKGVA